MEGERKARRVRWYERPQESITKYWNEEKIDDFREFCDLVVGYGGALSEDDYKKFYDMRETLGMNMDIDDITIGEVIELYKIAITCALNLGWESEANEVLGEIPNDVWEIGEFCKYAVEKKGMLLEFVPENLRTKEICEIAVNNYEEEDYRCPLQFVPEDFRTEKICNVVIRNHPDISESLDYIPKHLQTVDFFMKLIEDCGGYILGDVPENLKTEELCKLAVSRPYLVDFGVLRFVPEKFMTAELCEIAVKNDSRILQEIPEHLMTEKWKKLILEMEIQKNEN